MVTGIDIAKAIIMSKEGSSIFHMTFYCKVLTVLTFFLIPFLGGNHLPLHYVTVDRFWIEGTFGVVMVLSLLFQFLEGKREAKDFLRFSCFFLPFLAVTAVSLFYSWNKFNTVLSISVLVWAAGTVYLSLLCPDKHVCIIGLIAGAGASSVCTIIQHLILFPHLADTFQQGLYAQILREQQGIPFSSYSYHNILGGYLAFVFPLSVYLALYKRSISAVLVSGLIIAGVVLTSTRLGVGIVILTMVASIGLTFIRKNRWGVVKTLAILVVGVSLSFLLLHGGERARGIGVQQVIAQKAKTAHVQLSTINTRTDIWRNALSAFAHKPFIGYGAGAFEYAYRKYFDGNSYTGVAHSVLIKTLVELGIVGLICLCYFVIGTMVAIKKRIKDPLYQFIFISALSGLLFGLLDFSFDVASHVITFFVLSSFFIMTDRPEPSALDRKSPRALFADYAMFALLMSVLITNLYFDQRLNIFKASIENGDLMVESGFSMNGLASYREAIDAMPLSTEGYTKAINALASMYDADGNENQRSAMTKEITQYLQTMERKGDRDSELYLTMGKAYARMGDDEKTHIYFSRALSYYPSSGYYIHEIGSHYAAKGDIDTALAYVRSFDPYIEKYRGPHNPRGIFVYKTRDLEADLLSKKGRASESLRIARQNLQDAQNNVYVITSVRSRSYTSSKSFVDYLREKVRFYESI